MSPDDKAPPREGLHDAGWIDEEHLWTDQVCTVCGHAACPCCEDWCDRLIGDDATCCCDMKCAHSAPPQFFDDRGKVWRLIDLIDAALAEEATPPPEPAEPRGGKETKL